MSQPWEDYSGAAVDTETPPWQDFAEAKPWNDFQPLTPKAAPIKAAAGAFQRFAGGVAKGSGVAQEAIASGDLKRLTMQAEMERPMSAPPIPDTAIPRAAVRAGVMRNPQYLAGQVAEEAAPKLSPEERASKLTKAGELVGGAGGMALGPLAIPAFSLESMGHSIGEDYDKVKHANPGISENEASEIALDRAFAKGGITAAVFLAVPKALRGPLETYLVAKMGKSGFAQWLGGRAAAGIEGGAVLGTQDVAEHAVSGEAPDANTLKQVAAGSIMNLLLPWRRGRTLPEDIAPVEQPKSEAPPTPEPKPEPIQPTKDVVEDLLAEMTKGQVVRPEVRPPPEVAEPSVNAPREPEAPRAGEVGGQPTSPPERVTPSAELEKSIQEPARPTESPEELRRQLNEELGQREELVKSPKPSPPPADVAATDVAKPEQSSLSGGEGEGIPTVAEPPQKGKRVARGLSAGRTFDRETELTGPDILDWMKQNMKLLSKTGAKKTWGAEKFKANQSLWDDAPRLQRPHHNAIYSEHGSGPDRVAAAAYEDRVLDAPDVDELWRAIDSASKARAKAFEIQKHHAKMLEAEATEHQAWTKAVEKGAERISADDLQVGDHFEVEGERVKVVSIDPDTMDVTLEDGTKFGRQVLPSGKTIHVEKLPEQVEPAPLFGQPESVEEQRARTESESSQKQKSAAREAMLEKQAKPLVGSVGDIGQGDLLGGGDLFSAGPSIGRGIKTAMEKGRVGEAGFVHIPSREEVLEKMGEVPEQFKAALKWAQAQGKNMADRVKRMPNNAVIAVGIDSANNRGGRVGNMAQKTILHTLNRAFGKPIETRDGQAESALSFVIESGMDRAALRQQRLELDTSTAAPPKWKRRALSAMRFAETNWDRLVPVAHEYNRITDAQITYENANGIPTPRHRNYVHHAQDMEQTIGMVESGTANESGGPASPFRHVRDHATFAEAIANGVTPQSLNAVDLLHRRVTLGQKLVNNGHWIDGLGSVTDPSTQLPLTQPPIVRARPDGTTDVTAPPGYELQTFAGRQIALHKGYTGIFGDLTTSSVMSRSEGRQAIMKAVSVSKRVSLAVDTYHLGRLAFWNAVTRLGAPTYRKGLTLLDNTTAEIQKMAENGEIPAEWAAQLRSDKAKIDAAMRAGFNVGGISDNLYADWAHKIPVLGSFNKWLFEQYQRGAMTEVYLIEYERAKKNNPDMAEDKLVRSVVKDINTRFGNLQNQGILKNKTMQDLARVMFLAPQWNESLIRAELGAMKQAGAAIIHGRPLKMGMLARGIGTALVGQFFANQVINLLTRGKPTWENEEGEDEGAAGWWGSKISAYIPDASGGPGFFLNPAALPTEITHLLAKATNRHGGDFNEALKDFFSGRFSSPMRGVMAWWTGEAMFGKRPKTPLGRIGMAIKEGAPIPISGGAATRLAKQLITGEHEEKFPGQFQKQVMQSFGIKTENAPNAERRIRELAVRFNRSNRVREDVGYHEGDFVELTQAIRRQNEGDAKEALADLLEMDKSNGIRMSAADVAKHYKNWANAPFTHAMAREMAFYGTLSPAQQKVYEKARLERADVARKVGELLSGR